VSERLLTPPPLPALGPDGEPLLPQLPNRAARILVVDDHPVNLELLVEILQDAGYHVRTAEDGVEALGAVEEELPDAILLDVMMPRMDGYEVCRRLKSARRTCFVPVVMVTALSDVLSKVRGLDAGADDFINKPVHRAELLVRLRALLRIKRLRDELDTTEGVILAMVTALEGKHPRIQNHAYRVARLARRVGERLRLAPAALESLVWGALLHDIGKIGVPDRILARPPAELQAEERLYYESHPIVGERLIAALSSLREARRILRGHHERLDGSGFPDGLAGVALPLDVEIVAAADAYDNAATWSPPAEHADAASLLREAAREGRFHADVVEEVIAAAAAESPLAPGLTEILPIPAPEQGGHVLLVDDAEPTREIYASVLQDAGFRVSQAVRGGEVLEAVDRLRPDLVMLDMRMPDFSGDEVCRRLKAKPEHAFLPVVLVTAYEEGSQRLRGLESGADEFLIAPVDRQELVARVRSLLRLRSYHYDLENHEAVILSLSDTLEAKDPYTRGHSQRVGDLAGRLAAEMGLPEAFCARMRVAGLVHDIGKVMVPEAILNKPGALSETEMAVIKSHPVVGFDICRNLKTLHDVLPAIRHHHERFDGSGYPDGLAGRAIPLQARILALADAFDALTSARSYRNLMSQDEAAFLLVKETKAGRWDPDVFAPFGQLLSRGPVFPAR
jgi:putative two-component system response regulator